MMNLNSNVRNTENSELHRYCQNMYNSNIKKSVITIIQRGHFVNSVFVNPGIVASLVIVVIVSGNFFFLIT